MQDAIRSSAGTLVYFANAMTFPSQTDGFFLSDHVRVLEEYVGRKVDVVVANNGTPPEDIVSNYAQTGSELVQIDDERLDDYRVIQRDLLIDYDADHRHSELCRAQGANQHVWLHYIRHDSDVVAEVVASLL